MQHSGIKYIHVVRQLPPPPISRTFSSSQTETLHCLNTHSSFPPATFHHSILSLWIQPLYISYIGGIIEYVCVFLFLAYFTQHNALQVYPCHSMCQNFLLFLRLHNIPLCGWTTVSLSFHLSMDTWVASPFSSYEYAAMNMGEQVISQSLHSVLWGVHPEVELLDHTVIVFLNFWGTATLPRTFLRFWIFHNVKKTPL